jgi:transposase
MADPEATSRIAERYRLITGELDERARRRWAAAEAVVYGRNGSRVVAEATGLARATIQAGMAELKGSEPGDLITATGGRRRIRRPGAGRKSLTEKDASLVADLESLIAPETRGDPMSPLRWTTKSTRSLAATLREKGHSVSHESVRSLLEGLGYSLQGTRKVREGTSHPDRDAQFRHINDEVAAFQAEGEPTISVDTKKKENIGDFANKGREWQPKGEPVPVRVHDFIDPELGKAIPYGVYDMLRNEGWVSVGIDHDTAEFAVRSMMTWWDRMGSRAYPGATKLLITADCGGSNGYRTHLWWLSLQTLADYTGLAVTVCHLPPGTSKWNKIEHRLFSHITQSWRGRPLESLETVVQLIGNTRTRKGLTVEADVDSCSYPTGVKVSKQRLTEIRMTRHPFHGEWNYTIEPNLDASSDQVIV